MSVSFAELAVMYRHQPKDGSGSYGLYWAKRDNRWDVYPNAEPHQLVFHNYEGSWLPDPDGTWHKSCVGFVLVAEASAVALFGEWKFEQVTSSAKLWRFEWMSPEKMAIRAEAEAWGLEMNPRIRAMENVP